MSSVAAILEKAGLIGILRHLDPDHAVDVGEELHRAGLQVVEVPLNNEAVALRSIRLLHDALADRLTIGAGTVTASDQVERVQAAGGTFVVSPNTNPEVIRATVDAGMLSCPGVMTPSEAFTALDLGADVLKLFPASIHGPSGLAALRDVVPAGTRIFPVGGVGVEAVASWRDAGADGLGIGGALFKPGRPLEELRARATGFVDAWNAAPDSIGPER